MRWIAKRKTTDAESPVVFYGGRIISQQENPRFVVQSQQRLILNR